RMAGSLPTTTVARSGDRCTRNRYACSSAIRSSRGSSSGRASTTWASPRPTSGRRAARTSAWPIWRDFPRIPSTYTRVSGRSSRADGEDLSFVTVTIEDRAGVQAPTAEPLIRFRISGPARIVGVDNGDQISHASFQANQVRLFNGKALVIIRSTGRPGTVTLT